MALLTPLSLDAAQALGRDYGLEVVAVTPIAHGSVNSNFALRLAGGAQAFLRLYEESAPAAVEAQNRLLEHLVAAGVPTPAPLRRCDGGSVSRQGDKAVCIFPFVAGSWLCQGRVEEHHLATIGEVLARVHRAGERFEEPPADRFDVAALRERLARLGQIPLSPELTRDVARLAAALADLPSAPAPTTVVHGDLFRDNALFGDDGKLAAVIDFESASAGNPAFDLMVTMLAWCYGDRLEERLARALFEGYARERTLTAEERAACFPAARAAAMRFSVTRITDYELRPREAVAYKDYRRFLARLAALDALGPAGLARWIAG